MQITRYAALAAAALLLSNAAASAGELRINAGGVTYLAFRSQSRCTSPACKGLRLCGYAVWVSGGNRVLAAFRRGEKISLYEKTSHSPYRTLCRRQKK